MKICKVCGKEKPLADFYKHPLIKDGYDNRCKPCIADRQRERNKQNPERQRESKRRWAKKNPEVLKGYREKYKDKSKEYNKRWAAENDDKCREKDRRYRERHPERTKDKAKRRWLSGRGAEAKKRYQAESRDKHLAT